MVTMMMMSARVYAAMHMNFSSSTPCSGYCTQQDAAGDCCVWICSLSSFLYMLFGGNNSHKYHSMHLPSISAPRAHEFLQDILLGRAPSLHRASEQAWLSATHQGLGDLPASRSRAASLRICGPPYPS
mmetsp:Transcript_62516/g.103985  ORF Transcript_62516/g.103985 Transcript_62516/m.103985 type:complete len:128 (-) Transcript_62516:130-513(-)